MPLLRLTQSPEAVRTQEEPSLPRTQRGARSAHVHCSWASRPACGGRTMDVLSRLHAVRLPWPACAVCRGPGSGSLFGQRRIP